MINAIPTDYRGCRFRSRLEARWAAFFDIVGWPWIYEPVDLIGWTPDFALLSRFGNPTYVEVKPLSPSDIMSDYLVLRPEVRKCLPFVAKGNDVLVLGESPFIDVYWGNDNGSSAIGVFLTTDQSPREQAADLAQLSKEVGLDPDEPPHHCLSYVIASFGTPLGHTRPSKGWDRLDVSDSDGNFAGRVWGQEYGGPCHLDEINRHLVFDLWNEASSAVQWSPAHA